MNYQAWFTQIWPFDNKARDVLGQYASLRHTHALMLTDLALRGGVYAEDGRDASAQQRAFDAGRRSLALETLKLAKADPDALFELVERRKGEQR